MISRDVLKLIYGHELISIVFLDEINAVDHELKTSVMDSLELIMDFMYFSARTEIIIGEYAHIGYNNIFLYHKIITINAFGHKK